MKNIQAITKTTSFNHAHKLFMTVVVLACLAFSINTIAVEIKPTDSGNPIEISPDFEGLGSANQLLQDNSNDAKAKKKQHSWWGWLTSKSRKPANFHYIDFLELFHKS